MERFVCKDLECALESRRSKYIEARSAAYYRISTEFAANKTSIWSAKSNLEEHLLVCVVPLFLPTPVSLPGVDAFPHSRTA